MILPDGKVSRSLAEQVGFLTDELEDLQDEAEGFVKTDDIINSLDSTATDKPLSAAQGKVLSDRLNTAISGAMHYKGSVATYADLPTTGLEVGDLYNVIADDSNYAWTGSTWDQVGSTVDLSGYMDLGSAQTATGSKTFNADTHISWTKKLFFDSNNPSLFATLTFNNGLECNNTLTPSVDNLRDLGASSYRWKNIYLSNDLHVSNHVIKQSGSSLDFKLDNASTFTMSYNCFYPTNYYALSDLGKTGLLWRDLYLSRNLTDGTNSVTVADIAGGTFNVINASDIVSNTLTQAQYDLITNGKPTLISGTLLNLIDPIILNLKQVAGTKRGLIIGGYSTLVATRMQVIVINDSTLNISLSTSSRYIEFSDQNDKININVLGEVNGKTIPAYPSNTGTFTLKCVDGTLTWVAD